MTDSVTPPSMNRNVYDVLKWVALVLLPALGTLYFGLGQLWEFPAIEQVVGSIAVVDTFLGILINKSSKDYREKLSTPDIKGDIVVQQDVEGTVTGMRFETDEDPFVLPHDRLVAFRVRRVQQK